jgi:hypothetical protein
LNPLATENAVSIWIASKRTTGAKVSSILIIYPLFLAITLSGQAFLVSHNFRILSLFVFTHPSCAYRFAIWWRLN